MRIEARALSSREISVFSMTKVGRGNHRRVILSMVTLPYVLLANPELILSLTSRLSMSQGTSNAVATAATITSAAAAPANVIARGNFMGLMAAAINFSIVFSNSGGCFSATMVAL